MLQVCEGGGQEQPLELAQFARAASPHISARFRHRSAARRGLTKEQADWLRALMATNRSGPMRGAVRETKLQQSNWRADDFQRSSQRLLFAAAFLTPCPRAPKREKCQSWPPSLSLIEAASCGSLFGNGPFGPFEILSGPSLSANSSIVGGKIPNQSKSQTRSCSCNSRLW